MGYLPIFMDLKGRPCLVVGGGDAAEKRTRDLLEAGATVTVAGPTVTAVLEELAGRGTILRLARDYRPGDMEGFILVFAAASDPALHRRLAVEALRLRIPLNVADTPELCSFIMPAIMRRGDLKIAVSTAGASPATARRIREELEQCYGPEYAAMLDVMRAARRYLRALEPALDQKSRAARLTALARSPLLRYLRVSDWAAVEGLLGDHLGVGASLSALGLNTALAPAKTRPDAAPAAR